ncbi:hypothetical protein [Ruegeria hyattellae]|uniref:hypothetical protein n=1 Tax=Ruegeria hyattellae TaxID=3233337 RepID=UPI00355B7732
MMDQPVSVTLFIFVPPDEIVPEAELAGFERSRLDVSYQQEGSLQISTREVMVDISDALQWMVPALCFDGIVALRKSGEYTLDLFASDEKIAMQRNGDEIELKGEYIEPKVFPAGAFEAAMIEAGRRYLALSVRLWPDRSESEVQNLNERASAAGATVP